MVMSLSVLLYRPIEQYLRSRHARATVPGRDAQTGWFVADLA
jgi:hypothetical protein